MLQHVLDLRCIAGQGVKVRDGNLSRRAVRLDSFDRRIQRAHRDRHVGRVRGDAGIARTDDRELAAEALQGRAAAAGIALVAGLVRIVEIRAAVRCRRLPAVVARLRSWPEAPASKARDSSGYSRRTRASAARSVLRTSAPMCIPPSGVALDLVQRQAVHVDEMRGLLDLELHEVEQVGAAGDEFGAGIARRGCRSGGRCRRTLVGERLHALPCGRHFDDGLDDVRVRAAAADVAAHALADFGSCRLQRAVRSAVTWLGTFALISAASPPPNRSAPACNTRIESRRARRRPPAWDASSSASPDPRWS